MIRFRIFNKLIVFAVLAVAIPLSVWSAEVVQTFYIALPEPQVHEVWDTMEPGDLVPNMRSIQSIVVSMSNTIVRYDHWEDGYEGNLGAPTQTTTQVWGDNNAANGQPPGAADDILDAGEIIELDNIVAYPRTTNVLYDARDRFNADQPVSITRAMYNEGPGPLMAGAAQILDTTQYGLEYICPIGQDILHFNSFDHVSLLIMASEDPTLVEIDIDADGTPDETVWLRQGETHLINGGIMAGATVKARRPVQAHLMAGKNNGNYQMRFFTLFPKYQWSSDYVAPVGRVTGTTVGGVDVWLHNPNSAAIDVMWTNSAANGTFNVPANSTYEYEVTTATATRFYTTNNAEFVPVSTVSCHDSQAFDWGYALVPYKTLTTAAVCGWGWGESDPAPRDENYSPFWLSTVSTSNSTVYIDFDSDTTTGSTNDPLGNLCDIVTNIAPMQMVRLFDTTDNDQTGMRAYTLDGTYIVGAWGLSAANPPTETGGSALDMGTAIMPFPNIIAIKDFSLWTDDNGNGFIDPGDDIEYTLTIRNFGFQTANNVTVFDIVPSNVTYLAGSTFTNGFACPDDNTNTPPPFTLFALDEQGLNIGSLDVGATATVSYVMSVDDPFPDAAELVVNEVQVISSEGQRGDISPNTVVRAGLEIFKSSLPQTPLEAGDTITYSIAVHNTGTVTHANSLLTDNLPPYVTYVPGSTTNIVTTNFLQSTVLDEFAVSAFTNNDGTANWLSGWGEIGEADGPGAGYVEVSTSLGIGTTNAGVWRAVDMGGHNFAELSFFYRRLFATNDSEYMDVYLSTNGNSNWSLITTINATTNDSTNGVYFSYDATPYISTNTGVRFLTGGSGWQPSNDWMYVDNVQMRYTMPGGGSVTNAGGTPPVLASNLVLAVGSSLYSTFQVTVDSPPQDRWLVNETFVISDKQQEPLYAFATNEVVWTNLQYQLDKVLVAPLGRPALTGETVTFSITVTNSGTVGLDPVRLDDTFDTNYLSFVSAFPSEDTVAGNLLTWTNIGPLNAGASVVVTTVFTAVQSTYPSMYATNEVTSTASATNGFPAASYTDDDRVPIRAPSYLLSKNLNSPTGRSAYVSETITFNVSVTNTGDQALSPVEIVDTYDTNSLSYVTSSIPYDAFTPGSITWSNLGVLAIGQVTNVTIDFLALTSTLPGDTTNVAVSSVSNTNSIPLPPQTNDAPVQISNPDYLLSKTLIGPTNQPVPVGSNVFYRISVTNSGDVALDPVTVDDSFDTNYLSYVSAVPAEDSIAGGMISWTNLGVLAVGAVTNIDLTFTAIASTLPGATTNWATSTATTTNGYPLPPLTNDSPVVISNPDYALSKTLIGPTNLPVPVGSNVFYRISVTNSGDIALDPVTVDDSFDTNYLAYVSAVPAEDSVVGGTISWTNLGVLAVGAVTNIDLTFTAIASTLPGATTNWATSTATTTNGYPLPPLTNDSPVLISDPDYLLSKTLMSPTNRPATLGESVLFSISVTNSGDIALDPVTVVDTFDTNYLSFVSAVPAEDSVVGGTISWTNLGVLAAGAVTNIDLTFTAIASTQPGDTTNWASSTATTTNGYPLPPLTNDAPVAIVNSGYALDKVLVSPTNGPTFIGGTVSYLISVTNLGDQGLSPVLVTDNYDTNYLSYTTSSVPYDAYTPGSITWSNLGILSVGQATNVTVDFIALATTLPGSTTNFAISSVSDTNGIPLPPQTNDSPVVISNPDYALSKTLLSPTNQPVPVGSNVFYRISVTNSGDIALDPVTVDDSFDTNFLSFVSAVPAEDSTTGGTISWTNLGVLAAGAVTNIDLTFTALASTLPGATTNWATSTATTTNGIPLPPLTNDSPVVISNPDYALSKTLIGPTNQPVPVGSNVFYRITVTNSGDIALDPVTVDDSFDTNYLSYVSAVPAEDSIAGGMISWTNLGVLAVGAVTNIDLTFTAIASTLPGATTNWATSTATTTNGYPLPPLTNDSPVVISNPDYALSKTLLGPTNLPVPVGSNVFYRISVTNSGDIALDPVTVDDSFDTNYLAYVSAVPAEDSVVGGTISWTNLGVLAVGAVTNIDLTFTAIASTLPGATTNWATSTATTTNGYPLPPLTNDSPVLISDPDYLLSKTLMSPTNRPATLGESVLFSISVTNSGDIALDPVTVVDTFDTNYLSFVSAVPAEDSVVGGTISWTNLGVLAAGAVTNIDLTFTAIASTQPGDTTNWASSTATTTNGYPLPPLTNDAPVAIVNSGYALDKVLVSPTNGPTFIGGTVSYLISVTNLGDQGLSPVLVTDNYDTNYLSYTTSSVPYDAYTPGSITWSNLGILSVGQATNVTVDFIALATTLPGSTTNFAISSVSDTNGIPLPPQTNDSPVVISNPDYALSKTLLSPTNQPVPVGSNVFYRISVTNSGDIALDPVTVDDSFDTNFLSFVSAVPAEDSTTGGTISWTNLGVLAAGAVTNIDLTFTALASTLSGATTNWATSTATTTNGIPLPPLTNDSPVVISNPDYALSKTLIGPTNQPVPVGSNVFYRITVTNSGDIALDPVTVDDSFDTNYLSYVSAVPAEDSIAGGMISWTNLGVLAVGAVTNIDLTFTAIASTLPGATTNWATSTATTTNGYPLPPLTNDSPVVISNPDYALSKTLLGPTNLPVPVGSNVFYRISVTNSGDIALDPVTVDDSFDTNYLAYVSAVPAEDSVVGGTISWTNLGVLAVGAVTNIDLTFTAIASTLPGATTNWATSTATTTNGYPLPPLTNDSPVVISNPDYLLSKTLIGPTNQPVPVGSNVFYRITVTNSGDIALDPVTIDDSFDTNFLSFVSAVPVQDSLSAGMISWTNLGLLAVGAVTNIDLTFTAIASTLPGATTNWATSTATTTNGYPLPPLTNDSPVVISNPDYLLSKTLLSPTNQPVPVGSNVFYRISVTNSGDIALDPVTVDDSFDTNYLSYVSAVPAEDSVVGGTISWTNLGVLAVGAVTNIDLTFTAIASTLPGATTNWATSTATTTNGYPLPPLTNDSPVVISNPDYALSKTLIGPTNQPVPVGSNVFYRISVTNSGDIALDPVTVDDSFDTNFLSFVSAVPAEDSIAGGMISWTNLGVLAVGAVTNIDLTFTAIASTLPGATTNWATSTATTTNGYPLPPLTNDSPVVISNPDYALSKTLIGPTNQPVPVGSNVFYRISVTNSGDIALDPVTVDDSFDTNYLSFVSAIPVQDSVVGGTISWTNLGVLAVGAVTNIDLTFTAIASTLPGATTNWATSTATTTNGYPLPPLTNDSPVVISNPDYALSKTLIGPTNLPVPVGSNVFYRISVTNSGDIALDPVTVDDSFDTNFLSFVSAVPVQDSLSAGMISWTNLGVLAAGAVTNIDLTFTAIASTLPGATTNWATSTATTTNGYPLPPLTNDSPVVISNPDYLLSKTLIGPTNQPVPVGSNVFYRISVTNSGDIALDPVTVDDSFDTNYLSFVSAVPVQDTLSGGTISWTNLGVLAAGAVTNIDLTFTAIASALPGATTNRATSTATTTNGYPLPPLTNDSPVVISNPDYALSKTLIGPTNQPVPVGSNVFYRITVTNSGDIAINALVDDTFETNYLSFVSAIPVQDSVAGNMISWTNLGALAAGAVTNIDLTFTAIASTLPGATTNWATSTATTTNGYPLPPLTNDSPVVISNPDYALFKTLLGPMNQPVPVGSNVFYRITVTNSGDIALDPVTVDDSFDTNYLAYVSAVPAEDSVVGGTISWTNLGVLAVGAVTNIDLTFTAIASTLPGATTNWATSTATTTNGYPLPPLTNDSPVVISNPDYALSKALISPTGGVVLVGADVTYRLTVTNRGDVGINTTITDLYETNYLQFVSAAPAADILIGNAISWTNVGVLAAGMVTNIDVTFTAIQQTLSGETTNWVTSTGTTTNGYPLPPLTNNLPIEIYPLASIGDSIWYDLDGDGIQSASETNGIAGVLVTLFDATNGVVAVTNTATDGSYGFTNLVPGVYHIEVSVPPGATVSPQDMGGDDNLDSDAAGSGIMPSTTLLSGENDLSWDVGMYLSDASIGDYVWQDWDEDGIQDTNELGMANMSINLYDASTNLIASTTTDGNGAYLFTNLPPGDYFVGISTTTNYALTLADQGGDDAVDSDLSSTTALSGVIALLMSETNMTVDAGLVKPATMVVVASFEAYHNDNGTFVEWQTASEVETVGFFVQRLDTKFKQWVPVNNEIVASRCVAQGAAYRLADPNAISGKSYTYKLIEIESTGVKREYGPFNVIVGTKARSMESAAALASEPPLMSSPPEITGARIKITIEQAGVYTLSSTRIATLLDMNEAAVVQAISERRFALSSQGKQVSWLPNSNNSGIVFFASGFSSVYTSKNIYWLSPSDVTVAMRQTSVTSAGNANDDQRFEFEQKTEKNLISAMSLFADPKADFWMWDHFVCAPSQAKQYPFLLSGASGGQGSAQLTIRLKGMVDVNETAVDHTASFSVNDQFVGTVEWDGIDSVTAAFDVDQSILLDGGNTLTITGQRPAGVPYSVFYLDNFAVQYARTYRAVNNQLLFKGENHSALKISGFTQSDIMVLDVTDALDPVLLTSTQIADDDGSFSVSFDQSVFGRQYIATLRSAAQEPDANGDTDSGLRNDTAGSDYVIITVPGLAESSQTLADYRAAQGMRTQVVLVDDIYDEFNYGLFDPSAIRAFLGFAFRKWETPPRYVIFVGEGSYDYKDHLGYGGCMVPPFIVSTPNGLFASDIVLGDVAGDKIPEMAIGRIPANSSTELNGVIAKIATFEAGGAWKDKAVFAADNNDLGGNFAVDSDALSTLAIGAAIEKVYIEQLGASAARLATINALNSGSLIFNYIGHSGFDRMSDEPLFRTSDISQLTNSDKAPVVLAMTCVLGRYGVPGADSLGEALLVTQGAGAVAVWAPVGPSINSESLMLNSKAMQAIYSDGYSRLGDVIQKALLNYRASGHLMHTLNLYNLLGDPATALGSSEGIQDVALFDPGEKTLSYEEWRRLNLAAVEIDGSPASAAGGDIDGDGISNVLEYILNLNPNAADEGPRFAIVGASATKPGPDRVQMDMSFLKNRLARDPGGIRARICYNLKTNEWQEFDTEIVARRVLDADFEEITVRFDMPDDEHASLFVTLKIVD